MSELTILNNDQLQPYSNMVANKVVFDFEFKRQLKSIVNDCYVNPDSYPTTCPTYIDGLVFRNITDKLEWSIESEKIDDVNGLKLLELFKSENHKKIMEGARLLLMIINNAI